MNRFYSEYEMVRTFCEVVRNSRPPSRFNISTEFGSDNGIPDIVLTRKKASATISNPSLAQIPPRFAILFAKEANAFPDTFTHEIFSSATGLSHSSTSAMIKKLEAIGAITKLRSKEGVYKRRSFNDPFEWIVSIEAKLSNWTRALSQAYRYKEFSDQAWVLLDFKNAKPALRSIGDFVSANVGLAFLDTEGQIFIGFEPTPAQPLSCSRRWANNARLSRLLR